MTDREKLLEILSAPIYMLEGDDPAEAVADFLIDNDVRPVVRCRDCKWSRPDVLLDKFWCHHFFAETEVRDDDFCSYAERKEATSNATDRC